MSKKVTLGEEFDQKDLDKPLYHWFREASGLRKEINGSVEVCIQKIWNNQSIRDY